MIVNKTVNKLNGKVNKSEQTGELVIGIAIGLKAFSGRVVLPLAYF